MTIARTAVCVVLAVASASHRADALAGLPIGRAAARSAVTVAARSPGGNTDLEVAVRNAGPVPVTVDVFGSVFTPRSGGSQRLGVPRVERGFSDTSVTVAANTTWRGTVPCVCLDEKRSSPGSGSLYTLTPAIVPAQTRTLFAFWNEHLELDNSHMQSAVWKNETAATSTHALTSPTSPSRSTSTSGSASSTSNRLITR